MWNPLKPLMGLVLLALVAGPAPADEDYAAILAEDLIYGLRGLVDTPIHKAHGNQIPVPEEQAGGSITDPPLAPEETTIFPLDDERFLVLNPIIAVNLRGVAEGVVVVDEFHVLEGEDEPVLAESRYMRVKGRFRGMSQEQIIHSSIQQAINPAAAGPPGKRSGVRRSLHLWNQRLTLQGRGGDNLTSNTLARIYGDLEGIVDTEDIRTSETLSSRSRLRLNVASINRVITIKTPVGIVIQPPTGRPNAARKFHAVGALDLRYEDEARVRSRVGIDLRQGIFGYADVFYRDSATSTTLEPTEDNGRYRARTDMSIATVHGKDDVEIEDLFLGGCGSIDIRAARRTNGHLRPGRAFYNGHHLVERGVPFRLQLHALVLDEADDLQAHYSEPGDEKPADFLDWNDVNMLPFSHHFQTPQWLSRKMVRYTGPQRIDID